MQIMVDIPQAEAIKRGRATWGATPIDLAAVLAELSEEERKRVSVTDPDRNASDQARHLQASQAELRCNGGATEFRRVVSPTADTVDVIAAIQASIATIAAVGVERTERARVAIEEAEAWVAEYQDADPLDLAIVMERYSRRDVEIRGPNLSYVPAEHPVVDSVRSLRAAARSADDARVAVAKARREEAEEKGEALKALMRTKHEAERAEWIEAHGSRRLRFLLEEGLGLAETYRNERLAIERPGWVWYENICGETAGLRDASEQALDALVAARETVPDAELEWLRYADCDCHTGEDSEYTDLDLFAARPVLTAKLLGRHIVREV